MEIGGAACRDRWAARVVCEAGLHAEVGGGAGPGGVRPTTLESEVCLRTVFASVRSVRSACIVFA